MLAYSTTCTLLYTCRDFVFVCEPECEPDRIMFTVHMRPPMRLWMCVCVRVSGMYVICVLFEASERVREGGWLVGGW